MARAVIICAAISGNLDNNEYAFDIASRSGERLIPFADVDSRWLEVHHTSGAAARLQQVIARFQPRGITHYLHETQDASWLIGAEGLAFARVAESAGLVFSLACGPGQLATVRTLARRVPRLPIVLHHFALVRGDAPPEESGLAALLACADTPNIYVKISGFGYGSARPWAFPYPGMLSVFRAVLDRFGPDRLAWGSDYPVVNRFMTYRQSLELVRSECDFLTDAEREAILAGTMVRLLRLSP